MKKQNDSKPTTLLALSHAQAVLYGHIGGLKGGRSTSPPKASAARENGKLGGRSKGT